MSFSLINPDYLKNSYYLRAQVSCLYLANNLYMGAQTITPYLCAQIIWIFSDKPGLSEGNPFYLEIMWFFPREIHFCVFSEEPTLSERNLYFLIRYKCEFSSRNPLYLQIMLVFPEKPSLSPKKACHICSNSMSVNKIQERPRLLQLKHLVITLLGNNLYHSVLLIILEKPQSEYYPNCVWGRGGGGGGSLFTLSGHGLLKAFILQALYARPNN